MTKSSEQRKAKRNIKVLLEVKNKMERSLEKHFGPTSLSKLKDTSAWDFLADSQRLREFGTTNSLTNQIAAVDLALIPKVTAIRALLEGIEEAPVDEATKNGFKLRLANMVKNLKDHSSYEVILEVAIGGNPFNIDAERAILMLEKITHNLHSDHEDKNDST